MAEPPPPPPPYSAAEIQAFADQAASRRLQDAPEWRTLLHWRGRRSLVDDPAFFLAPNGKHNAGAELNATLAAFFAAPPADLAKAAACRFPARLEWLSATLGIDRQRLPMPECAEVEEIIRNLEPRGCVLVFPSAYMNTPASMFGHTLITVRGKRRSDRMNQAINYAALIPEKTNGFVFAFRGIFGFYPGYYSLMPYYQKIQEYSDLDQRDLWEYELNLTGPELRRVILHTWEMLGIYSDYYFLDENCSYKLLFTLEVARPGLSLVDHFQGFRSWVIPLDTIKVVRDAGLVTKVNFRPSLATQVRLDAQNLAPAEADLARQISLGRLPPTGLADRPGLAPEKAGRILDLSAEYLQSLRGRRQVPQADYQPRFMAILGERSRLPPTPPTPPTAAATTPPSLAPDDGHGSGRLTLGTGYSEDRGFAGLGWRPAYHDLGDPPAGFSRGSAVDFVNLALRWYDDEDHPTLERLDLLRLRSYARRDPFYAPRSWEIGIGVTRERIHSSGEAIHAAYLNGGVGRTWDLGEEAFAYTMIIADLRLSGLDHGYGAGIGPKAGVILPITSRWHAHAYAQWIDFLAGDKACNWELGLQQTFAISRNTAISLEASRQDTWKFHSTAVTLKLLFYF